MVEFQKSFNGKDSSPQILPSKILGMIMELDLNLVLDVDIGLPPLKLDNKIRTNKT